MARGRRSPSPPWRTARSITSPSAPGTATNRAPRTRARRPRRSPPRRSEGHRRPTFLEATAQALRRRGDAGVGSAPVRAARPQPRRAQRQVPVPTEAPERAPMGTGPTSPTAAPDHPMTMPSSGLTNGTTLHLPGASREHTGGGGGGGLGIQGGVGNTQNHPPRAHADGHGGCRENDTVVDGPVGRRRRRHLPLRIPGKGGRRSLRARRQQGAEVP